MATLRVDISEDQNGHRKVVGHTFHGQTPSDARRNLRSHRKSDKFFDAAMRGKPYKGLRLRVSRRGSSRG